MSRRYSQAQQVRYIQQYDAVQRQHQPVQITILRPGVQAANRCQALDQPCTQKKAHQHFDLKGMLNKPEAQPVIQPLREFMTKHLRIKGGDAAQIVYEAEVVSREGDNENTMHQDRQTGQLVLDQPGGWRLLFTEQQEGKERPMVWQSRADEDEEPEELLRSTAPVVAMNSRAAGSAMRSDIWHGR
jgi:hypothetical protein